MQGQAYARSNGPAAVWAAGACADEQQDRQRLLPQAIASLPPKVRAIVLVRSRAQLSLSQIACLLDMPATTAKTSFARAKLRLQQVLKEGKP
jgi:DNA-directed RNA polymerase specialized sigma24 family protein